MGTRPADLQQGASGRSTGLLLQRQVGSLVTGAAPPLWPHFHSSLQRGGGALLRTARGRSGPAGVPGGAGFVGSVVVVVLHPAV